MCMLCLALYMFEIWFCSRDRRLAHMHLYTRALANTSTIRKRETTTTNLRMATGLQSIFVRFEQQCKAGTIKQPRQQQIFNIWGGGDDDGSSNGTNSNCKHTLSCCWILAFVCLPATDHMRLYSFGTVTVASVELQMSLCAHSNRIYVCTHISCTSIYLCVSACVCVCKTSLCAKMTVWFESFCSLSFWFNASCYF